MFAPALIPSWIFNQMTNQDKDENDKAHHEKDSWDVYIHAILSWTTANTAEIVGS